VIRIADVQRVVARHYGLDPSDMVSAGRDRYRTHPRQVAMFLAREMTGHSTVVIGHWFCRDHSTIVHGSQAVAKRAAEDIYLQRDIENLREKLCA
jgi:chromosomal replication initiator protein